MSPSPLPPSPLHGPLDAEAHALIAAASRDNIAAYRVAVDAAVAAGMSQYWIRRMHALGSDRRARMLLAPTSFGAVLPPRERRCRHGVPQRWQHDGDDAGELVCDCPECGS